jgi:hypothetical protein
VVATGYRQEARTALLGDRTRAREKELPKKVETKKKG